MADEGGFDFHTPPKREAKRFEPPPWEQEAFDELERKRAEQAEVEKAFAEAQRKAQQEAAAAAERQQQAAQAEAHGEGATAEQPPGGPETGQLDERKVTAMLAELSVEEPNALQGLWRVAIAAAIVLGAIGAVLVVWALAAFVGVRRTGSVGAVGGAVLLFFGVGFVLGAGWLTVRTLRERGVL